MGDKIYNSSFDHSDAYLEYVTRWIPTIRYPLLVTTFSDKQCDDIQKPFIFRLLPKLGLNRHFPRVVLYSPIDRGGCGIYDIKVEQLSMQMTNCNGHMRRNDDAGKLITSNLRMMQVIVGTSTFFMNLDPDRYDYTLVNTKLHFFWKKWASMKLVVSLPGMWTPTVQYKEQTTVS